VISIVGTAATFISALIGAWIAYWLTVPRRRLSYALIDAFPIEFRTMPDQAAGSEPDETPTSSSPPPYRRIALVRGPDLCEAARIVSHESEPGPKPVRFYLKSPDKTQTRPSPHPYRLTIQIKAHGSRDISAEAFDEGRPLILDCGMPLMAQAVETDYTPRSVPAPKTTINGSALEVGPGLINRRHVISYNVFTESPRASTRLACGSSLTDVVVRRDRKDIEFRPLGTRTPQSSWELLTEWLSRPTGNSLVGLLLPVIVVVVPSLLHFISTIVTSPIVLGIIAGAIAIAATVVTVVYVRRLGFSN
jgi:hypothetical protein